jgi:high-affinity nickel permease
MNMAYGWAFFKPVRKVFYNLDISSLAVAICLFIGGIETLSLVPLEVHGVSQTSGFWGFIFNFNINTAGFVIVGMFIVTWRSPSSSGATATSRRNVPPACRAQAARRHHSHRRGPEPSTNPAT